MAPLDITAFAHNTYVGAAQIAARAADLLHHQAQISQSISPEVFRQELLADGWSLIQARPEQAPLVNLLNAVLWRVAECSTLATLRTGVIEATESFKRALRQHAHQVAEEALALMSDGTSLMTISSSSTVRHALTYAQRVGRRLHVRCPETEPLRAGRYMASELAAHGVQAQLIADAHVPQALNAVRLVLVGADLLSSAGLVNNVGTRALVAQAHAAAVPVYALCSSEKFLPSGYPLPPQITREGQHQITAPASFDVTALGDLAGIVTEQGVLPVAGIEAWLAVTKLHPALAEQLQTLNSASWPMH